GVTAVPPRHWPARPPAPEERAAAAAGKTAALGEAEEEAAAADAKPGARLDSCTAFVSRAERRLAAVRADVEVAEAAAAAARARVAELDEELQEGKRRLEELRESAPADGLLPGVLADVRTVLDVLERLPMAGHVGAGPALPAAALQACAALRRHCGAPPDGRSPEELIDGPLELPPDGGAQARP
ncbi:unnamed protein product, partial [Prorocentrum cordatum]